jgi:TolA-binding protein
MARPLTPLGSLGEKVAASLADDGGQRENAIDEARRQFLAQAIRPVATRRVGRSLGLALAAALGVVAVAGLWFWRAPARLQFTVDGAAGVAQTWLAAPEARPIVVQFSDGTVIDVEPSSRARVVDTDRHGASIAVESGALHAEVVHTGQSAWRLIAGPFAVRVTGTRFDLRWDSASQMFSITVREGSVGVAGSIVGAERPVRAGQTLSASVTEGRLELVDAPEVKPPAAHDDGAPASTTESAPDGVQAAPAGPAAAAPSLAEPSAKDASLERWREFAKRGDLRQAFAAAEASGFASVCDVATPAELLELGDAARLSGRPDRATEALLTLRRKFVRDPRRAAAAFALGKVAFDQRHAYGQAAEWFATCAREQPNGPLVREAMGRRVEALRNAGDGAGAQQAARDYLSRYPDGPHADIARSVLK